MLNLNPWRLIRKLSLNFFCFKTDLIMVMGYRYGLCEVKLQVIVVFYLKVEWDGIRSLAVWFWGGELKGLFEEVNSVGVQLLFKLFAY